MKLVFATNNSNKLREVQNLLPGEIKLLTLKDIGCEEEIEETAKTLEGNAKIKSDYIKTHYGYDCFADDTGLEVEALDGAPGVYSARYAGESATFMDNMQKLLNEMKGITNRRAQFKTVISLKLNGKQLFFKGICDGSIETSPSGNEGFGYDPVFRPEGFDLTFAEMDLAQKSTISHRGLAIKKLVSYLKEQL